jgi:hypothetical protein
MVVGGQVTLVPPITYSQGEHRFLRIRAASGFVYFETSGNNLNYIVHHQQAIAQPLALVAAELSVETSGPAKARQALFDNFRVDSSTFRFSSSSSTVGEGDGLATIMVTRAGNTAESATVDFTTSDGTATQPNRYLPTAGTLMFGQGESTKSFQVSIVDDSVVSGYETLNLTLSNPVGAGLQSPGRSLLTIRENDTSAEAPSVQFSQDAYAIGEGQTTAVVTVARAGSTNGTITVNYATSDTAGASRCNVINGQASTRCDYLTTLGTLTFASGETSKNILIPVIDDVYAEGAEIFSITLSNVVGAALGTSSTSTLTINDNDAQDGVNPIGAAGFFVRQHYVDFLNREPDAGGLAFWTNEITSCGADAPCIEVKRINVSAAFFLSIEFQETGYLVYRSYKSAFGNLANPPGAPVPVSLTDFLRDTQGIGQGVRVGIGDWQNQLEANKQAFTLAFVQRADFVAAYPSSMSAAEFVDKLNLNAGGVLSPAERTNLINLLGGTPANVNSRSTVLRMVADDTDLKAAESNKAFVLMQYFGYLRRSPNDAPDADYSGYHFWLNKLNSFGNYVDAEMVKSFLVSGEYKERFGRP